MGICNVKEREVSNPPRRPPSSHGRRRSSSHRSTGPSPVALSSAHPPAGETDLVDGARSPPDPLLENSKFRYNASLLKALKSIFKRNRHRSPHNSRSDVAEASSSKRSSSDHVASLSGNSSSSSSDASSSSPHASVLKYFTRFTNWDFDVIGVSRRTHGHPLLYVAYVSFLVLDLFRKLSLDETKVIKYLILLCRLHNNNNSYHNETRGASMVHSMVYFLSRGLGDVLSEEDEFACILCCCVSNVCHTGLDNIYQRVSESYLSTLWNDISTNQNVSLWVWVLVSFCPEEERGQLTRELLTRNGGDLEEEEEVEEEGEVTCVSGVASPDDGDGDGDGDGYGGLSLSDSSCGPAWGLIGHGIQAGSHRERRKQLRETVIEMVLATDIANFESIVGGLKTKIENASDFAAREDVKVLLQAVALFASLDYCVKTTSQYIKWVQQRLIQAFAQGDIEKNSAGFPVHRMGIRTRPIRGPQERLLEDFKRFLKVLTYQFHRMKFTVHQCRRNIHYWKHTFSTPECSDFERLQEYVQDGLIAQQKALVSRLRRIPIPANQHKNVSPEKQLRLTPSPTDQDKLVWRESLSRLRERFSYSARSERVPITTVPKLFAKCDVVKSEEDGSFEATPEERIEGVVCMFDRTDEWNFDMFALEAFLNDDPLVLFSFVLFQKYDWFTKFKIAEETLFAFLEQVRVGYQRNPYHNALHAADVMQIVNSICIKGGVVSRMTDLDLMAATVAGLVHDLDHPGLNDAFQVHAFSYLAKLYNDRSVLEAHHCSETFRLMREVGLDIFKNLTLDERLDCRKTMVEMIISTDMCNHAKYVKAFNHLIEEESDFSLKDHLRVALQIAIKIADVSNPSRPTYIYLQWTRSLLKEFFRQGDMEKEMDLPVSPLMDREKSVVSKGQNAFLEYVLIPMFKSFSSVFGDMSFTIQLLSKNKDYWRSHETFEEEFICPTPEQRAPIEAFLDKEYDLTS